MHSNDPATKYKRYTPIDLPDRVWPSKTIDKPPIWLSTDLRDGNQALANPMTIKQKTRFFKHLVQIGFKEIEIGYPAASDIDFGFVRSLIEKNEIPDDVWIQVLLPARKGLIQRTIEAVAGAKHVIVHMYNATCPCFRDIVFRNTKEQTVDLAVTHTKLLRKLTEECTARFGTRFKYQYSPETFSQTEPEFAVEICNAVLEAWGKAGPGEDRLIFNLPATVEIATPNHYADQVEYFGRHINHRDHVIVCLHPHNDRGTGIAATELALMAGADRVEGCIFGNGERTGNVDLANLALNLYTQGISPLLNFSDIHSIVETVTACTGLPIHPRHPYAGELVFTAFSGSHQDAIKKGLEAQAKRQQNGEARQYWDVPYLTIDPADIGCTYEAIIRVNSQSGKGGIAYLVKQALGLDMPKKMQVSFYQIIQSIAQKEAWEMMIEDITTAFRHTYKFDDGKFSGRISLRSCVVFDIDSTCIENEVNPDADKHSIDKKQFYGTLLVDGVPCVVGGSGNDALSALLDAVRGYLGLVFSVREYSEHSIGEDTNVKSVSYVELVQDSQSATTGFWGVGIDADIALSKIRAVISAVNSAIEDLLLPVLNVDGALGNDTSRADISDAILHIDTLDL